MMIKRMVLIFALFSGASAQEKTGQIQGQVVDESTQQPLPVVNVIIDGTQRGASTDNAGKYVIQSVPQGSYNVRFMMMGYETRVVNNVIVNPGRTTWQKIELKSTVLEADSVLVTAGYFHEAKDAVVSNRSMDFEEIRTDPGSAEDIQRVV